MTPVIVVEWALVKVGGQTVCRHIFVIAMLRVFEHVHVKNVHVYAPEHEAPNTDGWDPDSSTNVLIEDSAYNGGDDCVAIKSGWDCFGVSFGRPTVNVTIRNLTCHGHSASVAIGSEMSGGVENVVVEDITFTMANQAAKIKVGNTRGGFVRNVVYRNISVMGDLDSALHIDMFHFHNTPNPSCPTDWKPRALPQIDNISFCNINGLNANILSNETYHFVGMEENPIRGIVLDNVYFPAQSNPNAIPWNCSAVHGVVRELSASPWPPCSELKIIPLPLSSAGTTMGNELLKRPIQKQEMALCCLVVLLLCGMLIRGIFHGQSFKKATPTP